MIENVLITSIILLIAVFEAKSENQKDKPNIIIIIADDMGFNDVGFHGSNQIPTPNIDALAYFGIILNKHYTAPLCTPSRSSLMTGKYPSNVGLQRSVILSDQPYGLGLENKLISEYMKEAGYKTHLIGKWHLGFYRKKYTPTMRGFDTHKGYLGPYISYWDHTLFGTTSSSGLGRGLDMRCNLDINYDVNGIYATDLFTDYAIHTINSHDKTKPLFLIASYSSPHSGNPEEPLEAPIEEIEKFNYISDPNRRIYAAMVSRLDTGIGKLIDTLRQQNMLNNSIILFFSDNGSPTVGPLANTGSNAPLRGEKETPFEGGVRTSAAIWSPLFENQQRVSNQLIHLTDWLPTFARVADIKISDKSIDGNDIWNALSYNLPSPRTEVLCNIDEVEPYTSFISGDWKYISGTTFNGSYDNWLGELDKKSQNNVTFEEYADQVLSSAVGKALFPFSKSLCANGIQNLRNEATVNCHCESEGHATTPCFPLKGECLFNLKDDPCERNNLAESEPIVLNSMRNKLLPYIKSLQSFRNKPGDPRANPIYFNNTWTWWFDELNLIENM